MILSRSEDECALRDFSTHSDHAMLPDYKCVGGGLEPTGFGDGRCVGGFVPPAASHAPALRATNQSSKPNPMLKRGGGSSWCSWVEFLITFFCIYIQVGSYILLRATIPASLHMDTPNTVPGARFPLPVHS